MTKERTHSPSKQKKNRKKVTKKKKSAVNTSKKELAKRKPRKKKKNKLKRKKRKKLMEEIKITLIISFLLFSIVSYVTFKVVTIEGYSMNTTLNDRDKLFVNKFGNIKRFKMIYFKEPNSKNYSIRRIVGLPGEELYYKEDQLYINKQPIQESFLANEKKLSTQSDIKLTADFELAQVTNESMIPKDKYFVMGDNRSFASDSREYGFVDKKDIIGIVEMRIFPFHTMCSF